MFALKQLSKARQRFHQLLSSSSKPTISLIFHSSEAALSSDSIPRLSELPSLKPKPTKSHHDPELTQEEVTKINLLIPRLCLSNHLTTAINLTVTALLTNPPPKVLSFSVLIHSLTSQPDLTLPMSLLTRLKHTPQYLNSITTLLISSYLKKGRPKDALKLYKWMMRPGSPCAAEPVVYGALVDGFCRKSLNLEALKVLRDMVGNNTVPGEKLRKRVFMSLLREARIVEAKRLDEALSFDGNGGGEGVQRVLDLLDDLIANWME